MSEASKDISIKTNKGNKTSSEVKTKRKSTPATSEDEGKNSTEPFLIGRTLIKQMTKNVAGKTNYFIIIMI